MFDRAPGNSHRIQPPWKPTGGPVAALLQIPPAPAFVSADGSVSPMLWRPSEGPCRPEPGGAGGEPRGKALPSFKVCWD